MLCKVFTFTILFLLIIAGASSVQAIEQVPDTDLAQTYGQGAVFSKCDGIGDCAVACHKVSWFIDPPEYRKQEPNTITIPICTPPFTGLLPWCLNDDQHSCAVRYMANNEECDPKTYVGPGTGMGCE